MRLRVKARAWLCRKQVLISVSRPAIRFWNIALMNMLVSTAQDELVAFLEEDARQPVPSAGAAWKVLIVS